jgi:hypothetical protein
MILAFFSDHCYHSYYDKINSDVNMKNNVPRKAISMIHVQRGWWTVQSMWRFVLHQCQIRKI